MAGRPSLSIRHRRTALLAGALAVLVAVGALIATGGSGHGAVSTGTSGTTSAPTGPSDSTTVSEGSQASVTNGGPTPGHPTVLPAGFTVRAGAPAKQAASDAPLVTGKPLTKAAVGGILDRLPAWSGGSTLGTDFNWPAASLTKPAAGQTIKQTFPAGGDGQSPPNTPTPTPTGPLQVLRMQPQGSVSVAPFASITFNQPMIPVSTVGQLDDNQVPATISPAVAGHWDWIGTATLRFTADSTTVDRLPMATRFTLTVPAGTKSQSGGVLAKAASVTFSTPPPAVQSFTPGSGGTFGLHPVMVAVFNQRVDPATVLRSVTVSAHGQSQPVRLATTAEIAADQAATAALSSAPQGRTVALVTTEDLPAESNITVGIKAGTRSAEGSLTSTHDSNHTFTTYGPLKLVRSSCTDSDCRPGSTLVLTFDNSLDPNDFDASTVTVDPALPGGASISANGPAILISGNTQPSTSYRVTVKAGLTDVHGQKLTQPVGPTLRISAASTALYPFPTSVTTLDPTASRPTVTITTVNQKHFRERVFAVDQSDWARYSAWYTALRNNQDGQTDIHAVLPDWTVLEDRTVTVTGPADALAATVLDLSGDLANRKQVVVLIEPIDPLPSDLKWQNEPTTSWVQETDLSVDATVDQRTVNAWVTDLRTGAPVAGAAVTLVDNGGHEVDQATTDAHGLITVDLTSAHVAGLRVTHGDDTALLPGDLYGGSWSLSPSQDTLLWDVIDDRQTYRPGETVSIKGWVRRQAGDSTLALSVPAGDHVTWTAEDASNIHLAGGTVTVDAAGGFDLTVALPAGAHLGEGHIELTLAGAGNVGSAQSYHSFTIADFRTPSFQVDTHAVDPDTAIKGADVAVQADATYYAGGALGDAPVNWQIRTATASYSPPGWSSYTFGVWTPWWYETTDAYGGFGGGGVAPAGPGIGYGYDPDDQNSKVETVSGTTDGAGSASVDVNVGDLGKDADGLPVTVQAQATVTDVNRQPIADTADVIVHPAAYYVGLASDSTFVKQGEKLTLQAVATGIDGTVKAGRPITVTAARVVGDDGYGYGFDQAGSSSATLADPQTCSVTSATTPVTCSFTPKVAGEYRITALVTDEKGRTSRTQLSRWVAGVDGAVATTVQAQTATLVPDRQTYAPGQSAKVLVASPIATGTGLVTLDHNGIVSTQTFAVSGGSAVVTIPITEALVPGVTASVEVVGTVPRSSDPAGGAGTRPAYATGQLDLTVSTVTRTLTVSVKPRQTMVKPGGQTTVDVTVTDSTGKPVSGSQFEVAVVDEAVLALGGNQLPDPLSAFYPKQFNQWWDTTFGRATVMLGAAASNSVNGNETYAASSGAASSSSSSSAAGGGGESNDLAGAVPAAAGGVGYSAGAGTVTTPIAQRSDFDALALFKPSVTTDADGTAAIPVTLPDNLTRYRVQVVAVSGNDKFGTGDATITAGLTLTVRPTPPRFLNFGDHAEFPVVVQNLSDSARTTDVVLQAGNLTVTGSVVDTPKGTQAAGQEVTVPAHGRVEVRFAVAADQAGTARFRVAAVSGADADAAEQDIPVYTPSTSETFATYGTVEGNQTVNQKVTKPTSVIPAFGGLQVSTSSTALSELTDAVGFVADVDYQSADALAGQVIAISSMGDVLQAFSVAGLPSPDQLKTLVATDVKTLVGLQNSDGGFAGWEHGEPSEPFDSVLVVQALLAAQKYGYAGSSTSAAAAAVKKALPYLTGIDGHLPEETSQETRDTMNAYALAMRFQAQDQTAVAAADQRVQSRGAALPLDAVAWLLPVVSAGPRQTLLTRVTNDAVDDAGSVTFTEHVVDDSWTVLQSDTRTDALLLDALLTVQPDGDLAAKVVHGLMNQQRGGRWETLQENVFALLALRHYYDTDEATDPNFTAGVWLGDRLAGQHTYAGRTTEQTQLDIPTSTVLTQGNTSVTLADQGSGQMYYRIGLTTAPADLTVSALDRGFVVSRSYSGADHASDVTQDKNGVWHIKAGARVRITDTMVSRSAQNHVVLTDPLPAGLEPLNPALATTSQDLAGQNAGSAGTDPLSWTPTWYDHQDLRDERAEAFSDYLQGGVYTYSYLAVATTPGTFVVPPATAQQIYAPETFGRTATDHVQVVG